MKLIFCGDVSFLACKSLLIDMVYFVPIWQCGKIRQEHLLEVLGKDWHCHRQRSYESFCLHLRGVIFGGGTKAGSTCPDVKKDDGLLLMVQKSQTTTWDVSNIENNGLNYPSTGAGFLPSTVLSHVFEIKQLRSHGMKITMKFHHHFGRMVSCGFFPYPPKV